MPALARNKKARFDYKILETFEAGIVLAGHEVKSVKSGQIDLKGSFIVLRGEEAWLTNANIPPYKAAGALPEYDSRRSRKLLLQKREIRSLIGKLQQKGLTLVPLTVYTKHSLIKVEFGLAQGKKKHDKRAAIRERDTKRRIGRAKRR